MAQNVPCTTDKLIVGTYSICLSGVDLGSTTGGVTITQNNEFSEVRNDQTSTLQGVYKTQQDFIVTTTMRDMSLDKLRVLFGVKEGYNGTDELCIVEDVGGCTFPEEFSLTVRGPGPGCGCRNFHFPRVVVTPATVEYLIQRETPVEVAVEFRVLASCPEGLIGCITDQCDQISTDIGTQVALVCADTDVPNYVAP
jgi:hypothetical protein